MELGLLVLRLAVGLGFAAHGAQKLFGSFGGHGIDGTAGFFEQLGMRPAKVHATAAGTAELAGGLLLAAGLFTPFAAAALIAVMTTAVLTVHLKKGFFNTEGGYEYNLVLVAAAFAVAGIGAGEWSLDNALGLDVAGTVWALAALAAGLVGGLAAAYSGRLIPQRTDRTRPGQPHTAS